MIRIGYDDVRGYLEGGLTAWETAGFPIKHVPIMPAEELQRRIEHGDAPFILDVRHDAEWNAGHLPQAIHIDAGELPHTEPPMPKDDRIIVHCAHADRATVSISLLERRGCRNLILLDNGFSGWQAAGYPIVRDDE